MAEKKPKRTSRSPQTHINLNTEGRKNQAVTAETPLTAPEQRFVEAYIKTGRGADAVIASGIEYTSRVNASETAYRLLEKPNIKAEIDRIMEELHNETVATAEEVMQYFTDVMRGNVKDQFGLDAPLAERTRAAQELAKRTIDIKNRAEGKADQQVKIELDWKRSD